jgi:hypothetical protein
LFTEVPPLLLSALRTKLNCFYSLYTKTIPNRPKQSQTVPPAGGSATGTIVQEAKETLIYSLEGALTLCRGMAEVKQRLGNHAPFAPSNSTGRAPWGYLTKRQKKPTINTYGHSRLKYKYLSAKPFMQKIARTVP